MSTGPTMHNAGARMSQAHTSSHARGDLLVAGLGSSHGDDRFGWAVVDRLRLQLPAGAHTCKVQGGLELLEHLEGVDEVVVVDASAPAAQPGTIRSFEWPYRELAEKSSFSTHGIGLVEALRMAETLGRLPRRVRIIAVEAQGTEPWAGLSDAVVRQIDIVVEAVLEAARRCDGQVVREEGACTRWPW